MANVEPLGLKKLEAIHYYVKDVDRSRRFYCDLMDFEELGESGDELTERGRQKSVLFRAGECRILVSQPMGEGGRAARYLSKHPAGIGTLIFEVEDAQRTFDLLDSRGGTPINEVQRFEDDGGSIAFFSISTPFGDTTFRFVERKGYSNYLPGFRYHEQPKGGQNRFGFREFDHVTSNFQTMAPTLLWLEHVFGARRYWDVEFHTGDVTAKRDEGSGLRSVVMYEPHGKIKFANNEPMRPFFRDSQINVFNEDNRGDGVQHLAISVENIIDAVRTLRERGVEFMPTPGSYYDMLPKRIEDSGIGKIDEDISILRELGILVDGDEDHSYLLQIFLKEAAGLYDDPSAGFFFYELISRKGDEGFGAGNFRALFESIEREQSERAS